MHTIQYFYHVSPVYPKSGYTATLHKGDSAPLKKVGSFPTREAAENACKVHYEKACSMATAASREAPQFYLI